MIMPARDEWTGGAVISEDGRYRYSLWRHWWAPGMLATRPCWIMLNPSTADGMDDDPTIRRCARFSRDLGFGGMVVVNLYARRATDPMDLARDPEPEGPQNAGFISGNAAQAQLVIAAWGRSGRSVPGYAAHCRYVRSMLRALGVRLSVLALNKDGSPAHPLYLPASLRPAEWS